MSLKPGRKALKPGDYSLDPGHGGQVVIAEAHERLRQRLRDCFRKRRGRPWLGGRFVEAVLKLPQAVQKPLVIGAQEVIAAAKLAHGGIAGGGFVQPLEEVVLGLLTTLIAQQSLPRGAVHVWGPRSLTPS